MSPKLSVCVLAAGIASLCLFNAHAQPTITRQHSSPELKFPSFEELMQKFGNGRNNTTADTQGLFHYLDSMKRSNSPDPSKPTVTLEQFQDQLAAYWKQFPEYANRHIAGGDGSDDTGSASAVTSAVSPALSSFVEVASQTSVVAKKAAGGCEVCVYVVENKEQHQPFLCRGLKPPQYQQSCVSVLVSLMWWLENEVYWLNYGCQRQGSGASWEWVKPCPAHAVCSFIKSMYDRSSFCPEDPNYKKPAA